jgi:nucleoside-diphosphate-sugar epimerase
MKILITGGSGFIGVPLINKILAEGHEVLAISRSHQLSFETHKNIKWLIGDIKLTLDLLEEIMKFEPDCVVNLAWDKIPDFTYNICLNNLNSQIEFFNKISKISSIKKVINAGSCWEYNKLKGHCLESENCIPENNFTWAKQSLREYLDFHCKKNNIELIWARIFYVFGPNQRSGSLIPTILDAIFNGVFPELKTPLNSNDFIYIDDLVEALYGFVIKKAKTGIYNIGSGYSTPIIDIVKRILEIQNINNSSFIYKINDIYKKDTNNIEMNFWADISKIENEIGWRPQNNIRSALLKTIKFKQNK